MGRRTYLGIFAVSASALAYEIALTRMFAVTQWYHFAFMAVSLALLGFGGSGTLLALRASLPERVAGDAFWAALAFAASVPLSYLAVNILPFDAYRLSLEPIQILWMALFFLTLAVPFFFAGVLVAALLSRHPERSGPLYAANLLGSALGCLAAPILLALLGLPGAILAASAIGWLGAASFNVGGRPIKMAVASAGLALALLLTASPPSWLSLRLSPYKRLSFDLLYPESRLLWTGWNAMSRVDVVETSLIRSAPGLSLRYPHSPPPQLGIYTDGDNPSPITTDDGRLDDWASHLPVALPFLLRPGADALVVEPVGGLDVLVALRGGAERVTAAEGNPLLLRVARDRFGDRGVNPYRDARVQAVARDGRSLVRSSQGTFDVILLSLSDGFHPVTSGSYSLTETYLYTREAFAEFLSRLEPGGVLAFQRWLQFPASEELKGVATALAALKDLGIREPAAHLIAFRTMQTMMVLVSTQPFSGADLGAVRDFCESRGFDLVHMRGMKPEEANQHNRLPEPEYYETVRQMLQAPDAFAAQYDYDITPPTDDHPFFFHFFKWSQARAVLQMLGKVWLPFGGAGYFVLLILLLLALLASLLFILAPLLARRRTPVGAKHFPTAVGGQGEHSGQMLRPYSFAYFLLLGFAFLFVEIPLIQRFILYLGNPTYAFATVAGTLLLFSGLGSRLSGRVPPKALLLLVGWVAVCPLLLPAAFSATLGWALAFRVVFGIIILCAPGFLMGVPFPQGIRAAARIAPGWVPWFWAVNGSASVVASILAALLAVSFNFAVVLELGAGAYLLSILCATLLRRRTRAVASEPA